MLLNDSRLLTSFGKKWPPYDRPAGGLPHLVLSTNKKEACLYDPVRRRVQRKVALAWPHESCGERVSGGPIPGPTQLALHLAHEFWRTCIAAFTITIMASAL
jgi:hypothetical protein